MACDCGKSNDRGSCSCTFVWGLNTTVTGFGSNREPLRVTVAKAVVTGVTTATAKVTVTGTGNIDNPYILSINLVDDGSDKWGKWSGSQAQFDGLRAIEAKTLHAVIP